MHACVYKVYVGCMGVRSVYWAHGVRRVQGLWGAPAKCIHEPPPPPPTPHAHTYTKDGVKIGLVCVIEISDVTVDRLMCRWGTRGIARTIRLCTDACMGCMGYMGRMGAHAAWGV